MSHIASVNCIIKDLDALETAAEKFGATLVRGKNRFKAYYGDTQTKCEHVIEVNNNRSGYSIGVRKEANANEEFGLACDFFDHSLENTFGKDLVGLKNEYSAVVAEKALRRKGFMVRRHVDEPLRQVQLVATR